jgi:hypothetical protein
MSKSNRAYTEEDYLKVMALDPERYSLRDAEAETGVSTSTVARMRRGQWKPTRSALSSLLGKSPLSDVLACYMDQGWSLGDLTVLTRGNDPFRQDIKTAHENGKWLCDAMKRAGFVIGESGRTIHVRGLHYLLLKQVRPDGRQYVNTEKQWKWLVDKAGKAARWLGYFPFEQIVDERNAEPVIRIRPPEPSAEILTAEGRELVPGAEYFAPQAYLPKTAGIQPYRLAIIGEKSSPAPVLGPISDRYNTDLYLPTGEISDTQLYLMAKAAVTDGRPLIVFYFSDCDPSGWQMPISVSRKLQALAVLLGGELEFETHRVGLTPPQVREWGLPESPLKDEERRAEKWQERMGVEQTEIDAWIALRPEELDRAAREAIRPFFDEALEDRTEQARQEWLEDAQAIVDAGLDGDREQILAAAEDKLSHAKDLIGQVTKAFETSTEPDDLPPFEPPEPEAPIGSALPSDTGTTLISSAWEFPEQCSALKRSKDYAGDKDEDEALEES